MSYAVTRRIRTTIHSRIVLDAALRVQMPLLESVSTLITSQREYMSRFTSRTHCIYKLYSSNNSNIKSDYDSVKPKDSHVWRSVTLLGRLKAKWSELEQQQPITTFFFISGRNNTHNIHFTRTVTIITMISQEGNTSPVPPNNIPHPLPARFSEKFRVKNQQQHAPNSRRRCHENWSYET
jgi:hypothetical protein